MFFLNANLVTDDVICCASTVVRHKIKNISANNEAMLLKLGRDVAEQHKTNKWVRSSYISAYAYAYVTGVLTCYAYVMLMR